MTTLVARRRRIQALTSPSTEFSQLLKQVDRSVFAKQNNFINQSKLFAIEDGGKFME